jgi:hypothetical protein
MTADEALAAPAEYAHAVEIRSVGPAAVVTFEADAPPRVEFLYETPGECDALIAHLRQDELANELMRRFFAADADVLERERAHAERLAAGHPLEDFRAVRGAPSSTRP